MNSVGDLYTDSDPPNVMFHTKPVPASSRIVLQACPLLPPSGRKLMVTTN